MKLPIIKEHLKAAAVQCVAPGVQLEEPVVYLKDALKAVDSSERTVVEKSGAIERACIAYSKALGDVVATSRRAMAEALKAAGMWE